MMNRYKRPLLLTIIILLILFIAVPEVIEKGKDWVERYRIAGKQSLSSSKISSLVYLVKPEQWINFNIPQGTEQLKIIVNAHIQRPDIITVEDNWTYILRYQLIDQDNNVMVDKLYHQRSRLTSYRNEQDEIFFGNFYSGYHLTPLDGRLILMSTQQIKQAKSLRISLIKQSHEIQEAAIRLYIPSKNSESKLSALWLRMSKKNKDRLARHSVYPATLLSETEKINLLSHQWQPQGPTGIEGQDYEARTLYILKEIEPDKQGQLMIAAGLKLDPETPGIIPVPEFGGNLILRLTELDGTDLQKPTRLQVNWFGRGRHQRWQRQIAFDSKQIQHQLPLAGGLLQIKSTEPALIHAVLKIDDEQQIDITPKPVMATAYLANKTVAYQVLHVNNHPTAFRIDIRQFYDHSEEGKAALSDLPTTINYHWYDENKTLIETGNLALTFSPSQFDRLTGNFKDFKVSDSNRYFLNIPDNVSLVKFSSERKDLIVTVYNQPHQFLKNQKVPENSYVSLDKKNWFPSWFVLRPINQQDLIKQRSMIKVATQYRPPEDRLALLADQYLWEDYQPQQTTEARYILSRMDHNNYRDEALASVYCQLKVNRNNHFNLKTFAKLPAVSAELLFSRTQSNPFDFNLAIDGKTNIDMQAIGQQGRFKLPAIASGKHFIKLKSPNNQLWLMNHVANCPGQSYLKRRVFRLKNKKLSFLFNNTDVGDRIFSARFYSKMGTNKRSVIDVTIEPFKALAINKIQHDWTYTKRRYDIRPATQNKSIVLNSHGHYLNHGESFYIPFKSDMPKGLYRIHVTLKKGASGYISLSQINPGFHEQIRFYNETYEQSQ